MSASRVRLPQWGVIVLAMGAVTLSLVAQTPAPGQPGGQTAAPAGGQQAPPADQGRGGRMGGRGAPMWEPDFSPKPPVLPLSPEEQAKRFWLPQGFRIEPVLTEPHVQEPAQIAFDGNGRMFVVELRGYMQDADATGELDPVGRISVHEDTNGDGIYDTHGVFIDDLVFPRFVMPFGRNAVLAKESNADEVWLYTDTDGDGTADKKELFATGFGRVMNVEHQESGLRWALDNWMYTTINPFRVRRTQNGVLREPTGSNAGQWGTTQDNYGKMWFQGGASGMPGYFQLPVVYGNFNYPEQFEPELNITWGAPVRIADMQGGMAAVRMPDGSLARATGAAGNDIYRGDRLPADMIGDYFYGEVVARIVRRLRPVKAEGLTQLRNVYEYSEFIRSTDPLFRPVDVTTAPDGTMYITDMYRGIIQEAQWSGPGTYLRQRIEQYQLDKIVRHGRIWRLTYEGMGRRNQKPRMLEETPAELVRHLSDPNGWWRDTAQQLLVLSQDTSVAPALVTMARSSGNQLARIHALWTLEGLGAADPALFRELMEDPDPQIRIQAIRASETLYKAGDTSFAADYRNKTNDADVDVVMQAMMTLNTLKVPDAAALIAKVMERNRAKGVQLVASTVLKPPSGRGGGAFMEAVAPRTPADEAALASGEATYAQVCFACHGEDGRGGRVPGAEGAPPLGPALASSPRVLGHENYVIKALLHGLTGPLDGGTHPEMMAGFGQSSDEWIAEVASYVRNAFGNRAPMVKPEDVARIRAAHADRKTPWHTTELLASLPRPLVVDSGWKLSASHNDAIAGQAVTLNPWTSGHAQAPGMWLQIEMPQTVTLTEIQFESPPAAVDTTPAVPGAPTRTGAGRGVSPPTQPGFPRGYEVEVSTDGSTWTQVATGTGTELLTDINFDPIQARFVRIRQTGEAKDVPWSVRRLRLYEPGATVTPSR
jgi:mono/diheme cytochrome c family protein/glucose/arabinose dehydrogenase